MNVRAATLRMALAGLLGFTVALVLARSPFLTFLPPAFLHPWLTPHAVAGALAALIVAFAAARARTALAWSLAVASTALVAGFYAHSTLDWSLLLKDWDLTSNASPLHAALLVALPPLLVAWAVHAVALAGAFRERYAAKGVAADEVDEVAACAARASRDGAATALAATVGLWFAFVLLAPAVERVMAAAAPAPFLVPIAATALVAGVIAWLLRRDGSSDPA